MGKNNCNCLSIVGSETVGPGKHFEKVIVVFYLHLPVTGNK
jgi:hypothetical protein